MYQDQVHCVTVAENKRHTQKQRRTLDLFVSYDDKKKSLLHNSIQRIQGILPRCLHKVVVKELFKAQSLNCTEPHSCVNSIICTRVVVSACNETHLSTNEEGSLRTKDWKKVMVFLYAGDVQCSDFPLFLKLFFQRFHYQLAINIEDYLGYA